MLIFNHKILPYLTILGVLCYSIFLVSSFTFILDPRNDDGDGAMFLEFFFLGALFFLYIFVNSVLNNNRTLNISYATSLFILLFYIFVLIIFSGNENDFSSMLYSSTSGIIFFFILGISFREGLKVILQLKGNYFLFLIGIFLLILLVYSLLQILPVTNDLTFMLKDSSEIIDKDIDYQRSGDFVIIFSIIIASMLLGVNLSNSNNVVFYTYFAVFSLYIVFEYQLFVFLQLLGSNKSTVISMSVGMIAVIKFLLDCKARFKTNTNHLELLIFPVLATLFLLITVSEVSFFYNLDYSTFRIFGESDGSGILDSRLDIIKKDLAPQLYNDWLFGGFNKHELYGYTGKYIHSLPIYVLTHMGVVGFIIVFIFLFQHLFLYLQDKNKSTPSFKRYANALLLIQAIVFFIAVVGTSIFWSVLWFTIGLTSSLFFKQRLE